MIATVHMSSVSAPSIFTSASMDKKPLDLHLHRGDVVRRLRFYSPQDIEIEIGFPSRLTGWRSSMSQLVSWTGCVSESWTSKPVGAPSPSGRETWWTWMLRRDRGLNRITSLSVERANGAAEALRGSIEGQRDMVGHSGQGLDGS